MRLGVDNIDIAGCVNQIPLGSGATGRLVFSVFRGSDGLTYSVEGVNTVSESVYVYRGGTLITTITAASVYCRKIARLGDVIFAPYISGSDLYLRSYNVVSGATTDVLLKSSAYVSYAGTMIQIVEDVVNNCVYAGFVWLRQVTTPTTITWRQLTIYKITAANAIDHRIVYRAESDASLSYYWTDFSLSFYGANVEFYYRNYGTTNEREWRYAAISGTDSYGTNRYSTASSAYEVVLMGPDGWHCRGTDRILRTHNEADSWDISSYIDTYYQGFVVKKDSATNTAHIAVITGTTLSFLKLAAGGSITVVDTFSLSYGMTQVASWLAWDGVYDVVAHRWYMGVPNLATLVQLSSVEVTS